MNPETSSRITARTAILFIIFVVIGVYYPVIFAGYNSIDDERMIEQVEAISDPLALFFPSGAYYRPVVMLSYFLDQKLFGLQESVMHLENVVFHLLNVILVFFLARTVLREDKRRDLAAFIAALVFALHPLNVEPVAWISGRTDVLASLFVLVAAVIITVRWEHEGLYAPCISSAFLFAGCITKEVAFFFYPGIVLLLYHLDAGRVAGTIAWIRRSWPRLLPYVLSGSLYFWIRFGVKEAGSSYVRQAASVPAENAVPYLVEALRAFGFYAKKLFLPLPLNFAILEVNRYYAVLAVVVLPLLVLIYRRKSIVANMFCIAAGIAGSALIVAVKKFAWTPYAERYMYLPLVFVSIALAVVLFKLLQKQPRLGAVAAISVVAFFGYHSAQRVMVWQTNLSLYQDTLRKSPNFGAIRNELAIALIEADKGAEAVTHLNAAKTASVQYDKALLYVNEASVLAGQNKYQEAYELLKKQTPSLKQAHPEILKMMVNISERQMVRDTTADHDKILRRLQTLHQECFNRFRYPDTAYRLGQLYLALKEPRKAQAYFTIAAFAAPADAFYGAAARKMADKLRDGAVAVD